MEKTLLEVCKDIFAGGDVPKGNWSKEKTEEHQIPIFSNGATNKGLYGYTNFTRVNEPAITVSARGTIGYSQIRTEPFLPVVRLIVLIPDENIITLDFLKYTVESMEFLNTGASIPQLTVPMIKKYKAFIPSINEQIEIVNHLNEVDKKIAILKKETERKLIALDELRFSYLHHALREKQE